ncbi:MAG: GLUG motif-containing protein, partial [Clostridia bacterium]|nr:GLUG motif-containing protein [Clostridia bacterium]
MAKKLKITLLSILTFVVMLTASFGLSSMFSTSTTAYAMSGNGSESSPYLISTKADLEAFRNKVNAGETKICGKLMADINLGGSGSPWTPIGTAIVQYEGLRYSGTFDGNGHTVSGIYIYDTQGKCPGFFAQIDGATVKNLTISGSITQAYTEFGRYCGGLVGRATGNFKIINCVNNATVTNRRQDVGGIVGCVSDNGWGNSKANGVIEDCVNNGNITAGTITAGGIAGTVSGILTINRCYNTGAIATTTDYVSYSGGIMAYGPATIKNCYNTGKVTGNSCYVGGIVGDLYGKVENCHNYGTVAGKIWQGNIWYGAIAGHLKDGATVNNAYYLSGSCAYAGNGKVLSAAEMKDTSKFSGFDFNAQWEMKNGANYPTLLPAAPAIINDVNGATLTYGYTTGGPSVSATAYDGHTLSYKWYKNTTDSNIGGTIIDGETSATCNIPTGLDAGNYYFYCVVTSSRSTTGRSISTTTDAVEVVVNQLIVDDMAVSISNWVYGETPSEPSVNLTFSAPIIYEYKLRDAD